jgi:hypothetical protein
VKTISGQVFSEVGLIYTLLFPAAIDKRNFPELEFEELMALQNESWKGQNAK